MNLCSYNHEEICYEDRDCPLCLMIQEYDETISNLETDIKELQERNTELEDKYETLFKL